jgi:hypothetical protein
VLGLPAGALDALSYIDWNQQVSKRRKEKETREGDIKQEKYFKVRLGKKTIDKRSLKVSRNKKTGEQ